MIIIFTYSMKNVYLFVLRFDKDYTNKNLISVDNVLFISVNNVEFLFIK